MSEYAARILSDIDPKYDVSDAKWMLFLKDHRTHILSTASILTLDRKVVNSFRYYTSGLLIEYKLNPDLRWIIMWLNQIKGEWEVIDFDKLIVPSEQVINALWDKYLSVKNKSA